MFGAYSFVIISWRNSIVFFSLMLAMAVNVHAQNFSFKNERIKQTITFKLIKNLLVIPVYINNKGPFDFLLDTGVGPLIILNPSILDSVNTTLLRKIKIAGLGLEEVEAHISNNIRIKIGAASSDHMPAAILNEDLFNLSGYLGVDIYGIIGYNFFNNFIVEVRYSDNTIKFYLPDKEVKYKGTKLKIDIYNQKPYVIAPLEIDGVVINARLLMDTGASHALSLESVGKTSFKLPKVNIPANLGMSLSGEIKGNIARVKKFYLSHYIFNDVVSGFPNIKFLENRLDSARNGTIGADILKRFNIQFNYQKGFIYLKPNRYYSQPFEYDMLGATTFTNIKTNRVFIAEVDTNSPAETAGLMADDEIIGVNFRNISSYKFNELPELFRSKENRNLIFEILRAGVISFKVIKLQKRI